MIKNYWLADPLQIPVHLLSPFLESSTVHSPPLHWSPDLMLAVWVEAAF